MIAICEAKAFPLVLLSGVLASPFLIAGPCRVLAVRSCPFLNASSCPLLLARQFLFFDA